MDVHHQILLSRGRNDLSAGRAGIDTTMVPLTEPHESCAARHIVSAFGIDLVAALAQHTEVLANIVMGKDHALHVGFAHETTRKH